MSPLKFLQLLSKKSPSQGSDAWRVVPNPALSKDALNWAIQRQAEWDAIQAARKTTAKPNPPDYYDWEMKQAAKAKGKPVKPDDYAKELGSPARVSSFLPKTGEVQEEVALRAYQTGRIEAMKEKEFDEFEKFVSSKYPELLSSRFQTPLLNEFFASINQTPVPVAPSTTIVPRGPLRAIATPSKPSAFKPQPLNELDVGLRDYIWNDWVERNSKSLDLNQLNIKGGRVPEEAPDANDALMEVWPTLKAAANKYMNRNDLKEIDGRIKALPSFTDDAKRDEFASETQKLIEDSLGDMPPNILIRALKEGFRYRELGENERKELIEDAWSRGFIAKRPSKNQLDRIMKDLSGEE